MSRGCESLGVWGWCGGIADGDVRTTGKGASAMNRAAICLLVLCGVVLPSVPEREAWAQGDTSAYVVGAAVGVGGAERVTQRTEALLDRPRELARQARVREDELARFPAWNRLGVMEKTIASVEAFQAQGDLSRAYETAYSWQFKKMQDGVADGLLDAMPFLVLGPFGEPGFTDTAAEGHPLCEGFQAMTNAYLGEILINKDGTPNPGSLRQGFVPDPAQVYTVHPGAEAKWQPALKTEFLALDSWCAESPLWMMVYLYTEIHSPEARKAAFRIGCDYSIGTWIYMNGRMFTGVRPQAGALRAAAPDQRRCNMSLKQGWNQVLVKTIVRRGSRFYLRVTHGWEGKEDAPMHDLKYRLPGDDGLQGGSSRSAVPG